MLTAALAQRPCSRCISNNKADSCVDVQHKKRGRPRLRDDRESRYDASRFGGPPEPLLSRPLSAYEPGPPMGMGLLKRTKQNPCQILAKLQVVCVY